jgi:quercetin 2,3-dioxygenase
MKKLSFIRHNNDRHWVGDGFPVRSIFSYNDLGKEISPFLLLDYAGPENFPPSEQRREVGAHPHRGFETVTIVYSGEVEHRDSSGGGGIVRPVRLTNISSPARTSSHFLYPCDSGGEKWRALKCDFG